MEERHIYPIFDRMLQRSDRENLLKQKGLMLWFTGLSGSGKSTLAIAEVSKLFVDCGIVTIAAFISPTNEIRQMAADIIGKDDFMEIYVSTPLEVCEQRDVKGLYKKARKGEIKDFTGISSPFEIPEQPDLTIDTSTQSLEESVAILKKTVFPRIVSFNI